MDKFTFFYKQEEYEWNFYHLKVYFFGRFDYLTLHLMSIDFI